MLSWPFRPSTPAFRANAYRFLTNASLHPPRHNAKQIKSVTKQRAWSHSATPELLPLDRPFVRNLGIEVVVAVFFVSFHFVRTVVGTAFLGIVLFRFWAQFSGHFGFHPGDQIIQPLQMVSVDITGRKISR
jgi:hypothetical protein